MKTAKKWSAFAALVIVLVFCLSESFGQTGPARAVVKDSTGRVVIEK